LRICSACHVVATDEETTPVLRKPPPSLQAIANRPDTSLESLRSFLLTIHRTLANGKDMPNPDLTDEQARDIAAYMMTLRRGDSNAKD
jgi:mono/diheme cytochrome c family protein